MSFTSLRDAYTTSMDTQMENKYKRPDVFSQITTVSAADLKPFNVNYESFGNISEEIKRADQRISRHQPAAKEPEEDITCDDIIDHVRECEYCRSKLNVSENAIPEHLQNTLIYAILGIFLMFILDLFVKLGKMLK